jgi:cystathionine beta-lyase/cystathionine gamma-synthase
VDGKKVLQMATERTVKTIVDNTFATPHLWRPLEDGADIVVHSATKYLSGHGNLTAGVVAGNCCRLRNSAREYRKLTGSILSPDDAYRLGTQLKTFDLRFAKQSENAYKLACESPLRNHRAVKGVRYPGLTTPDYQTHAEARKTFLAGKGFGAMITLDLGSRRACDHFVEAVSKTIRYVPTLGDPETILLHVETVFGKDRYPNSGLLRLSVGFEPYDELESTILRALDEIP